MCGCSPSPLFSLGTSWHAKRIFSKCPLLKNGKGGNLIFPNLLCKNMHRYIEVPLIHFSCIKWIELIWKKKTDKAIFENLDRDFETLGIGIAKIRLQIRSLRSRNRLYANFGQLSSINSQKIIIIDWPVFWSPWTDIPSEILELP